MLALEQYDTRYQLQLGIACRDPTSTVRVIFPSKANFAPKLVTDEMTPIDKSLMPLFCLMADIFCVPRHACSSTVLALWSPFTNLAMWRG